MIADKLVNQLTERERELLLHQKLIEHSRHQRRVGSLNKMNRQRLAHSEYVVRLDHYLGKDRPMSVTKWLMDIRRDDFRAYQAKLADIDIRIHELYMWWFRLGDEQRYSLIRCSFEAIRDEHEQEKKYRYVEKMRKLRESGEI